MPDSKKPQRVLLHLLSDSSGNLLEHIFNAILTQFPRQAFSIQTTSFLKTGNKITETIAEIDKGVVFHAMVSQKLKKKVASECSKRKLQCWDVTGPTVNFLERATGIKRAREPKPVHSVDVGYMRRVASLEFAIQHDDSRRIEDLSKADIILAGISRVSKSPNSLFLAYRGFRVANISIVPSQGLPKELECHQEKNVVALTMQPRRLAQIRRYRFSKWKLKEFNYENMESVVREVMEAERIYKKRGWPIVDATDLAVEETSAMILSALHLRHKVLEYTPDSTVP